MRYFFLLILLLGSSLTFAQSKKAARFAKTITESELKSQLSVLAADSLEGRDTGAPGQKKAAKFIEDHFRSIGLEAPVSGLYIQEFPLIRVGWGDIYLKKGNDFRRNLTDFVYQSSTITKGEEPIELIFLGDSLEMAGDLAGKFLVIKNENWNEAKGIIRRLGKSDPAGYILVSSNPEEMKFLYSRMQAFYEKTKIQLDEPANRFEVSVVDADKIIITSQEMISWLFDKSWGKLNVGDETNAILNVERRIEEFTSENVLGFLPGEGRDELIVITSHYDHVGVQNGEIYNGADDDGSGTTAVMEIAEAFTIAAKKNKLKRSILFMCVSGEEKGLLGSKYYTQNPVFPLESTMVNLNIDMIGRTDKAHQKSEDYIYIIGSDRASKDLHRLSEEVNKETVGLIFDYKYNDVNDPERFFYRSDHYNFAKNGIPIIFYFSGTHEDYHRPTDTIDKVQFDLLTKRARLIFYTAWELANREDKLKLD